MGYLGYKHYIYLDEIETRYPFKTISDRSIIYMEFGHTMALNEVNKYVPEFKKISDTAGYIPDSKFAKMVKGDEVSWDVKYGENLIFNTSKYNRKDLTGDITNIANIFRNCGFQIYLLTEDSYSPNPPDQEYLFGIFYEDTESGLFFLNMMSDILRHDGMFFYYSGSYDFFDNRNSFLTELDAFIKHYSRSFYFQPVSYMNPTYLSYRLLDRSVDYMNKVLSIYGEQAEEKFGLTNKVSILSQELKNYA